PRDRHGEHAGAEQHQREREETEIGEMRAHACVLGAPVMAGLVPAIHALFATRKTWMPGTRPGMTAEYRESLSSCVPAARLRRLLHVAQDRVDHDLAPARERLRALHVALEDAREGRAVGDVE